MKILIACEFSGIVRDAFIKQGHDAWSCDLLPSERKGNHILGDVLEIIDDDWDMMIAHPPCTYLCRHRSRWNYREGTIAGRESAEKFFMRLYNAPVRKICIENPIPLKVIAIPKYSQTIQPWMFGHDYSKKTCLWLKNLPPLMATNIVKLSYYITPNGRRFTAGWYKTPRNWIARSRTFKGIAQAMATQWS